MNSVAWKTSSAGQPGPVSGTTGTSTTVTITVSPSPPAAASQAKDVEGAVYTYLKAMRALNRTHVTPEDVAAALGISVSAAMAALTSLKTRGVRRSR
jgi:hypothetical protein